MIIPDEAESFTEFYILDSQGTAKQYPDKVNRGDNISLLVGVVSHEKEYKNYRVEVKVGANLIRVFETGILVSGEKWEEQFSLQIS